LNPGAWSGSVVEASEDMVYKMVSQERWDKVRVHVGKLQVWAKQNEIPHKELERVRGFLVYVSMTYATMVPFLKGIHLTLDS
jgi:hypothetical protein